MHEKERKKENSESLEDGKAISDICEHVYINSIYYIQYTKQYGFFFHSVIMAVHNNKKTT